MPKLAGAAVVAAVRGDAAVVAGSQKQHLVLPGVGVQRAAMTDDHRCSPSKDKGVSEAKFFKEIPHGVQDDEIQKFALIDCSAK